MNGSDTNAADTPIDVLESLRVYLRNVCPYMLFDGMVGAEMVDEGLELADLTDSLSRFAASSEQCTLVAQRLASDEVKFALELKVHSVEKVVASIAFIKNQDQPLEPSRPILSQLQVICLPGDSEGGDDPEHQNQTFFHQLHQVNRHFYTPLARSAKISNQADSGGNGASNSSSGGGESDENIVRLQKRLRELDVTLEQCQRGTSIPSIKLHTTPTLQEAANNTEAVVVRNYVDKFNPSQADTFFVEVGLMAAVSELEVDKEEFVDEVNKLSKIWPQDIMRQVRLVESPFAGSVEKEVNFWKDMDRKLTDTKDQLNSAPAQLTKLVLKRLNRVSEQRIHEAETMLDKAINITNVSLAFLRDFPIEELQSAVTLHPKLSKCVVNCLIHFSKLKHSQYDFSRAVRLMEVLGGAVLQRIVFIIREQNIMQCPLEELRDLKRQCDAVLMAWKTNFTTQRGVLKDVAKRRNEKNFTLKFDFEPTQNRLHAITGFREQHERLLTILSSVLVGSEGEFITELSEGYQIVLRTNTDVLDVTPTGSATWASSMQLYEKRLEKVEEQVTRILEDRLSGAKTADEMFRIFAVFNPLFFRPAIRNAVNSFRATLVKNVREDVKRLQEKFKHRYDESHERVTADLRDIPPLSGRIIWARQIENQLVTLMSRIRDVLGVGWEDHMEGKALKEVCDELSNYLDTNHIYEEWLQKQLRPENKRAKQVKDFLLLVDEDARTGRKFITVNFDDRQVVVFKEVKYLEWLLPNMNVAHKTIPSSIKSKAAEAYQRYPTALALQSVLASFLQAKKKINANNSMLLVAHLQAVREVLGEAIGGSKRSRWIKWDSQDTNEWVHLLSSKVYNLQERVDDVNEKLDRLEDLLGRLQMCAYEREMFDEIVSSIQGIVDELPMRGLSNIPAWVAQLDKRLEGVVRKRLESAIRDWVEKFKVEDYDTRARMRANATTNTKSAGASKAIAIFASLGRKRASSAFTKAASSAPAAGSARASLFKRLVSKAVVQSKDESPARGFFGGAKSQSPQTPATPGAPATGEDGAAPERKKGLVMEHTVHEIVLSNQVLDVSPPLEHTRKYWITELHNHISVVGTLPRVMASRYQVFAEAETGPGNYTNLLPTLDAKLLRQPYLVVEEKLNKARQYVQQWLQYQTLWDASSAVITDRLGRDVPKWQQLLSEIKAARSAVDSSVDEELFGPVVINHKQVQNKINVKYDTWQKESQNRFGAILNEDIKAAQAELVGTKSRLEAIVLEGSTKDVIIGVELILKTKSKMSSLTQHVEDLRASEKLLQSQRFQFPSDWMPVSNPLSTLADLTEILERRVAAMDVQLPAVQQKIKEEDDAVSQRKEQFMELWQSQKPVEGHLVPSEVLDQLSVFTAQLKKLQEDSERVWGAKEALGMDFISDDRLAFVEAEIQDLREAWTAVSPTYNKLQAICAVPLAGLEAVKIRKQLEDLANEIRSLPSKVRSYAAVEHMLDRLSKYLSFQPALKDVCTDALKERHWRTLLDRMGIHVVFSSLTVGHIWDSNPMQHHKVIMEILSTAAGEQALEQFLKDVREYWVASEMQIVVRDGVKFIVGWDVLFSQLEDHLNSLVSLKQSPYFRNVHEFQEETANWESRLTTLRGVFEIWLEVQRKWVYLRGIFKNADIKAQLPAQHTKFKSIDNEYVNLAKRVSVKPAVLDLLQIDNLHRQLERQDTTMGIIQKALGEYLEKQRQIFPRFYFVNNDDLVEIMGNSNEPGKIVVHLSKMFAAISSIKMHCSTSEEEGATPDVATTMCSKEGEVVTLVAPIDLKAGVKDWLASLEMQMAVTLASLLQDAVAQSPQDGEDSKLLAWIDKFPAQVTILSSQVSWGRQVETALSASGGGGGADGVATAMAVTQQQLFAKLRTLSECVLRDMEPALRKKCEQLLTELVHQRDVVRALGAQGVQGPEEFGWLYHLRYYFAPTHQNLMQRLSIKMANASFFYGFEYLGIQERLVQTPLTDRCYLTLTQALHFRMGANPFGPAGTGKTESVKMLGAQLGRFVLVFNCDASFDYAAMGRIFSGLCQVGAWGCFDEFNRLEERILSAVSQQILGIQKGLLAKQTQIELMGSPCKLSPDVGIFVTMNPGYAGRSNLPDNLKQLFRAVAMSVPDRKLIAQVMLFSQGVVTAEDLAGKIVLLFTLCEEQLSVQPHYDFGLRALKSVLVGAGDLKRKAINDNLQIAVEADEASGNSSGGGASEEEKMTELRAVETKVLIKATCDSVLPKLVSDDIPLFTSLLQAVFPGLELPVQDEGALIEALKAVCEEDSLEFCEDWVRKVLQLKQVLDVRHGVMLVGPSGSGKTCAWRTLLKALGRVDGAKGDFYVIDPKAISTKQLYGTLDPNTLEWTDGVFTKILRKVSDTSTRASRRSWILFDGDVDPDWAENLNSVLDDNKVLTLPSGDRLKIPPNVRIMMEVDTLKHATLATVSRCGMIWFAEGTVSLDVLLRHQIVALRRDNSRSADTTYSPSEAALNAELQGRYVDALAPQFASAGNLVGLALQYAQTLPHVMDPATGRLVNTLYSMLVRGLALVLEHNDSNADFPMSDEHMNSFANKWLLFSLLWSFGGTLNGEKRVMLCEFLMTHSSVDLPPNMAPGSLIDLQASIEEGGWVEWALRVPRMEMSSQQVAAADVVITTTDTVRHVEVLRAWLASHMPLILCGPPGSGKTMTLTSVLDAMPDFVLASLNFSSGTTPDLILKTFAQYCEVVDSPDGLVMQPNQQSYAENVWLVVLCDEINLPAADAYGTQAVIMFLRQLTEQGGYWTGDCKWISLRRIQFVGACNPPTDAGRTAMSERFLRLAPILLVDYPAEQSLKQIYGCFLSGVLQLHPNLKGMLEPLTGAMVHYYLLNQRRFTPDVAPQYVYSPRELSRWIRALYSAMEPLDAMTAEELVRLWAHEALRLFQDRLMTQEEKDWADARVDETAAQFFEGIDVEACLQRPILFSNWIKKVYESTDREVLREFVSARLKVFYEEELDVQLAVFDEVLDHVLRINSVLAKPMGHVLLVGESGVGKTVLTKFVSWMNGLTIFTVKANNRYTIEQFDEDLRGLLRRVGVDGEKVCFIFDESNALGSAFLERMNSLLASGEVPGLYEGEERVQLIAACKEAYNAAGAKDGVVLDSEDEIQRKFTKMVQRNLHVAFTMNPASGDFTGRCTTSPALFNRCVVDWFGTWSDGALAQVGYEFTKHIDTGYTNYTTPAPLPESLALVTSVVGSEDSTLSEALVAALVSIHNGVKRIAAKQGKLTGKQHFLSPRDYLDLIKKLVDTEAEKRHSLEEQQTHIRTGLRKLTETAEQVAELNKEMVEKSKVLQTKEAEANQKLTLMVDKQNEAEQRKTLAEKLTVELEEQNEAIRVRKESVEQELSEAEPALMSAKHSVQNIKKAHLDEVRALARPPGAVKLTLEMVSIMIGEATTDWGEIRKIIRRDDFIPTVVNFDPMNLTAKQVSTVRDKYLSSGELDGNAVDRASKACGPLYKWASSQIQYATILRKIKPLRDEVAGLEKQSAELTEKHDEAVQEVSTLQSQIGTYKTEYADSIRMTEMIRSEMTVVTKRVERAQALLLSLENERVRWEATSHSFDDQMSTLIGDNLLAAAFLTYGGIFDHKVRRSMTIEWTDTLEALGIPYRSEMEFISYLSKPSDVIAWRGLGLPGDDLATQNAILLQRFNRYPLMVDPSGQATNFILQKYAADKIVTSSFLDPMFMKTLSTSIRFGIPLLVQDVENIDPVLNPILNKELQKNGGRTMIQVGSEDIDFSDKFIIILVTRNPTAHFTPDVCSRVTMINFTVTPASLESQALSAILKVERPDVDKRRSDVLRLQGEQAARLRDLQDQLLNQISAVQGNILDDDSVISMLATTKRESAELMEEAGKTKDVLEEVKEVSSMYTPLASAMAAVYFSLEGLNEVSFLYQFSLNLFLHILDTVFKHSSGAGQEDAASSDAVAQQRLEALKMDFFREVSRRVLTSLRHDDKLIFLVRLAQLSTMGQQGAGLSDDEMDFLLKGGAGPVLLDGDGARRLQKFQEALPSGAITESMAKQLCTLSLLPVFSGLLESLTGQTKDWEAFMADAAPEDRVPVDWMRGPTGVAASTKDRVQLLKILLIKALRPERVLVAMESYASTVFPFDWRQHCLVDLQEIVEVDSQASAPLMLCSGAGQDASSKVDKLSTALGKQLLQVSMGSAEGYVEADRLIAQAAKAGSWVLLRNVHLCSDWLSQLEKRLHGLSTHANFRIFLTCEISPKLPSALLRMSEVIVFEASTGIKANMQKFLSTIPAARMDKQPAERSRLYGLLAWFNAVVQERLRYTPLGWTKGYEFSEADTACSADVIDAWVDQVAGGKAHVDPKDLPWQALRVLLSQSLYGGRVEHRFDQAALDSFIESVFNASNYASGAALATDPKGNALVTLPDGLGRQAFDAWLKELPDANSPAWIGLPGTAESHLKALRAQYVLRNLALLQLGDVGDAAGAESGTSSSSSAEGGAGSAEHQQQQELRSVGATVEAWLGVLPALVDMPKVGREHTSSAAASPLQRCLARELVTGLSSLRVVLEDLRSLSEYCQGETKATNLLRDLIASIRKGTVPQRWRALYTTCKTLPLSDWVADLARRAAVHRDRYAGLLEAGAGTELLTMCKFWVGGMFNPEAFITATRQHTAQVNKWSLEDVELSILIGGAKDGAGTAQDTSVEGVMLEGAAWNDDSKAMELSETLRCNLPSCVLRWTHKAERQKDTESAAGDYVQLPLYLTEERTALVFEVLLHMSSPIPSHVWAQRGAALILQASL